jgi:putative nucleotidyltransferase with HDIG domain
MRELDEYLNKVQHLPPAPAILPQLLVLLNQEDIDCGKVVDLITYDPSLTASVLQLCNSAAKGGASRVSNITEAIMRIGFFEVYCTVASVLAQRALAAEQKGYGMERGDLWKHSISTALAAQTLAQTRGESPTLAFTAALLHDIGKLVLANALEQTYARLVEETEKGGQSLLEAEKKLLGVQHAEIGARLLVRWNFPTELISAVEFHHDPARAGAQHERLAAYVYLGNVIAYSLGFGFGRQAFAFRTKEEGLRIVGAQPEELERAMIRTLELSKSVQHLVNGKG